jgi:ABC-type phosphate/phosphonate transport system permease subunit
MKEMVVAYLLGPAVMLLVCAAIWAISRRSRGVLEERIGRWLDAHRSFWMRHRH